MRVRGRRRRINGEQGSEAQPGRPARRRGRGVVEVRPALRGWRACLARTAGVPTALMPFYGATPRDALDALVSWLSHAHGVAAGSL